MSLVQRSLCACTVIALTALLRAACRSRLPRRMFVALWDLAVLRLLVPLSLPWAYAPQALMHAFLSMRSGRTRRRSRSRIPPRLSRRRQLSWECRRKAQPRRPGEASSG